MSEVETETQDRSAWLAEEQAALRRVATLVASGTPHDSLLRATVDEVRRLLQVDLAAVARYHLPDRVVVLYRSSDGVTDEVFDMPLGGENVATLVAATLQAARMDDYSRASGPLAEWARSEGVRSIVGAPVIVAGRLWGVISVTTRGAEALPGDTEKRLASFTELLAMAIANVESQEQTTRLLEEQAALRRVATLVAQDTAPAKIFAAVSAEVDHVFGLDPATFDVAVVGRFDSGPELLVVGISKSVDVVPLGSRWPPEDLFAPSHVLRTGRSARIRADDVVSAGGEVAEFLRQHGYLSQVASPIVVNGRLWGAMSVNGRNDFPPDTEGRLERFTELLAAGIANTESRAELTASRARVVAASDETRRRIERDLHDGVQQRILSLVLEVQEVQAQLPAQQLGRVVDGLNEIQDQLREVTSGLHPAMLAEGGLASALATLARRAPLPVYLDITLAREPSEPVEVAVYFIVSELITNAAKYAQATRMQIALEASDGVLRLAVEDDGVGGADRRRGSGLLGLSDRVAAMSGAIQIKSPPGEGTAIWVDLPLEWTAASNTST